VSYTTSWLEEITRLILDRSLTIVFQPIFDVSEESILGYEALTRLPPDSLINNPEHLFNLANKVGMLSELELHCRKLAINRFAQLKLNGLLFLNVSPCTLSQADHPKGETLNLLKCAGIAPDRVVIEITEQFEAKDNQILKQSLEHYRELGFKIAIDDLGTGHSGLKQWSELRPDIVKIDRYFISGCHQNIVKRELLRTIFELGTATGVSIIAEGIELNEEFLLLEKMGMQFAQGFLLSKPAEFPDVGLPDGLSLRHIGPNKIIKDNNLFELEKLITYVMPVSIDEVCSEVYQIFKKSAQIQSIAVIDQNQKPIGVIYRDTLAEIFSSDYGHALYDKKPITNLMSNLPFIADISASIDDVSNLVTDNIHFDLRPEFIVVDNGKYVGVASIRSLLKIMTEQKIQHAQHANPLTMLPGNIVIEQKIMQLLANKQTFSMAYFDLNHFKPFNDLYGYGEGDAVIRLVADVLSKVCSKAFVGHVGGDDFVVLFQCEDSVFDCKKVLEIFEQRINSIFKPEHLAQGGYFSVSRKGNKEWFSLMSLSCGIIHPNVNIVQSHLDVANLASEAKKMAKTMKVGEVYIQPTLNINVVSELEGSRA
jgi:diguanylate cyclase (GGDEF)-like protein